jgi:hypothetical protein
MAKPDLSEVDPRRLVVVQSAVAEFERVAALAGDAAGIANFLKQRVPEYWADVLHQSASAPHPPQWCGAFALWNLHQAGLGLSQRWMFGPPHYGFLYRLHELGASALPEPGDIAYLDKPYQHHAVVHCVEGDLVHTIDGNQGVHSPILLHTQPLRHWSAFFSIDPWLEPENIA